MIASKKQIVLALRAGQMSLQQSKQLAVKGEISQEDLAKIISIDPTPKKKFVGWMTRQWIDKSVTNFDELRNTIEEFNTFLTKGKTTKKDIYAYPSFQDLKQEVDHLNNSGGNLTNKVLENDYEVIRDDADLLIMVPHTHEASRKLGLTHFAARDIGGGKKDCAWCTTYKNSDHFDDYYYGNNVTFFYIKVKSDILKEELQKAGYGPDYQVMAVAVIPDPEDPANGLPDLEGYNAKDQKIGGLKLIKYLKILGLE